MDRQVLEDEKNRARRVVARRIKRGAGNVAACQIAAKQDALMIVDPEIRRCVQHKLKELGDPKTFELDPATMKAAKNAGTKRSKAQQSWFQASGEILREGRFQKATVTSLGEVRPIDD